jgi:hypothetical protein
MPSGCTTFSCVTILGGGFTFPAGVAVDLSDNVYVADDDDNAVKKIPPGCFASACVTTFGGGFNSPIGVAVATTGNGNVYVTTGAGVYTGPANCTSSGCVTTVGGGFTSPQDVAVDVNGDLYIADGAGGVKEMPTLCTSSVSRKLQHSRLR